jgi:hypothetical protein
LDCARCRHAHARGGADFAAAPHHDIYSAIEDLAEMIHEPEELHQSRAAFSVKLVAEVGLGHNRSRRGQSACGRCLDQRLCTRGTVGFAANLD